MDLSTLVVVLVFWVIWGVIAAVIASNRGGDVTTWLVAGVLFGPLSFPFALFEGNPCPFCTSRISRQATVCPKCSRSISEDRGAPNEGRRSVDAAENRKTEALVAALERLKDRR